ncbi:hypothetical protein K435DRAFT_465102 [Dendrothele bispora CBS 962.96]|uniref:Uncharacterized protein n=1 Tax=Dendrothele bispora (strain CBS 962.96) TaxID=1314807 RepID=A0A4S8L136_DENBC|nr:hypothetical protein K435DRAFT_465102 [Dendrothele bispora CBS 962.96]
MAQTLPAITLAVTLSLAILTWIWFRLPPDTKVRADIELRCVLFPWDTSYRLARSVLRQASSYADIHNIPTPEDFAYRFSGGQYDLLSQGPASEAFELYQRCRDTQSEDSWLWNALASKCIKVCSSVLTSSIAPTLLLGHDRRTTSQGDE